MKILYLNFTPNSIVMNFLKKNMGTLDKTIRISIAFILLGLYIGGNIPQEKLALVIISVCAIFLITSVIGFCPLYFILKISTKKAHHHHEEESN